MFTVSIAYYPPIYHFSPPTVEITVSLLLAVLLIDLLFFVSFNTTDHVWGKVVHMLRPRADERYKCILADLAVR